MRGTRRKWRRLLRWPALGFCVVLLTMMGATGASAHATYYTGMVYGSEDNCTEVRSELNHDGTNTTYMRSDVKAWWHDNFGINCAELWNRPPGYLRVRSVLQKQGSGTSYSVCITGLLIYNNTTTYNLRSYGNHPYRPCGGGSYRNLSTGGVRNGSTWYEGTLTSGNHLF